jgi:hypothetical protein
LIFTKTQDRNNSIKLWMIDAYLLELG